jgi:hypothetical protein
MSEGSLGKKITLQRSPNFQPPVFRMEWHPFSTFCSAGILPAFRSPEGFWGSNVRNLNTCAKRTRNSRGISTSILKDLNMPGISTYTKIIARLDVLGPPLKDAVITRSPRRRGPLHASPLRVQGGGDRGAHFASRRFLREICFSEACLKSALGKRFCLNSSRISTSKNERL